MRDCSHMPGAAKETPCPLCKDLKKYGQPITDAAIKILNQQVAPGARRVCPECHGDVEGLVSRKGQMMCEPCARGTDDEESDEKAGLT